MNIYLIQHKYFSEEMRKSSFRENNELQFLETWTTLPKGCIVPYLIEIVPMVLKIIFNSLHCNWIMFRWHYIWKRICMFVFSLTSDLRMFLWYAGVFCFRYPSVFCANCWVEFDYRIWKRNLKNLIKNHQYIILSILMKGQSHSFDQTYI